MHFVRALLKSRFRNLRSDSMTICGGLKILVVDDERDTSEMLEFVFNDFGAIVQTAQSVEAALAIFDKWQPDMLVSDIGMPNVDGYELIRIIREERGSGIPAIALTAMVRVEDRLKALTAGYQMHVAKPVELGELITIASGLVGLVNRRSDTDLAGVTLESEFAAVSSLKIKQGTSTGRHYLTPEGKHYANKRDDRCDFDAEGRSRESEKPFRKV